MTSERVSIILETISFFLVTLDLFGTERLNTLHQQIRVRLNSIKPLNLQDRYADSMDKDDKSVIVGFLTQLLAFALIIGSLFYLYGIDWYVSIPGSKIYRVTAILIIIFIWALVFVANVYSAIGTLDKIVNFTLGNLVVIIGRFKLEGVMLLTGAVLFLISKIIVFIN